MGKVMPKLIHIHPDDNVVVAIDALEAGDTVEVLGRRLALGSDVPAGHPIALEPTGEGEAVVQFGHRIAVPREAAAPGARGPARALEPAPQAGRPDVREPRSSAR